MGACSKGAVWGSGRTRVFERTARWIVRWRLARQRASMAAVADRKAKPVACRRAAVRGASQWDRRLSPQRLGWTYRQTATLLPSDRAAACRRIHQGGLQGTRPAAAAGIHPYAHAARGTDDVHAAESVMQRRSGRLRPWPRQVRRRRDNRARGSGFGRTGDKNGWTALPVAVFKIARVWYSVSLTRRIGRSSWKYECEYHSCMFAPENGPAEK